MAADRTVDGPDRAPSHLDAWLEAFLEGSRAPADSYAPDVVTWHAATGHETPIDLTAAGEPSFARLRRVVPDLRREDVRVERFDGGLVLQSTTVGTVDGEVVRAAACLVVRTGRDGRIRRFEEYVDRRAAAPFARAFGPA